MNDDQNQLAITETEPQEVVKTELSDLTVELIAKETALAEARRALKAAALNNLRHKYYWDRFGDNVRLNRKGAEHAASLLGIDISYPLPFSKVKLENDDCQNGHYAYSFTVKASHSVFGHTEFVGCCDSFDSFLGTNDDKPNSKTGRVKTLLEVNESNIMRKAQSNGIGNAVGRLLGIHNLPADQFEAATKLLFTDIPKAWGG